MKVVHHWDSGAREPFGRLRVAVEPRDDVRKERGILCPQLSICSRFFTSCILLCTPRNCVMAPMGATMCHSLTGPSHPQSLRILCQCARRVWRARRTHINEFEKFISLGYELRSLPFL